MIDNQQSKLYARYFDGIYKISTNSLLLLKNEEDFDTIK